MYEILNVYMEEIEIYFPRIDFCHYIDLGKLCNSNQYYNETYRRVSKCKMISLLFDFDYNDYVNTLKQYDGDYWNSRLDVAFFYNQTLCRCFIKDVLMPKKNALDEKLIVYKLLGNAFY